MGRKKRRQHKKKARQPQREAAAPKEQRAEPATRTPVDKPAEHEETGRRRPALHPGHIGIAAVVLVAAVAAWILAAKVRSSQTPRLTGPRAVAEAVYGPALDDFAGAESCEECHQEQYDAWTESVHAKAGGEPDAETIIAPFDGTPMRFADALVTPMVNETGQYQFLVQQPDKQPQVLTVSGVIGGGWMEGGGTQGFVSAFPDGTIRFLPFDYIKQEEVWFCNTISRTDKGWIPIERTISLDECADWPPVRIMGTDATYANCQECHVAQIELVHDSTSNMYSTRLTTLAIDCESCHGPMGEHVEKSQPERIADEDDIAVEALATLSKDESLQICFRCHALKDVMRPGYIPGKPLTEYYSVGFTSLGGGPLHPDGRIRTFGYQGNHRYSDCYLNGSMTCVDCHDPHTQEYRDIWGRALVGRFDDEQCTDCHPSKAERPEEHTFHEAGTEGSKCVDCHMPYLQHPELGYELRFSRSDHTIPIPRPGFDDRIGVINACALSGCHPDSSLTSLQAITAEWYGEIKPHKPIVDALFNAERIDEARSIQVLLDSAASFPAAQVAAIGAFVTRFLGPNMARHNPQIDAALRRLARSNDLDVKAVALAALHLAWGDETPTETFLSQVLEESAAVEGPLRDRWATALGTYADTYFGLAEWDRAVLSYRKALEVRPQSAAILMNLGLAQAYAGDHQDAATSLRRSITADSRQPLAWVNLGFSLESLGDTVGAEQAYRTAMEIKDDEAMAHFNLANLLIGQGELTQAIRHYERTLELQPTLEQAHLYLVRAYVAGNDVRGAVIAAQRWVRYAPNDPRPRELLQEVAESMQRR
jgi:tetratricopeptide (TPR) repeat protein